MNELMKQVEAVYKRKEAVEGPHGVLCYRIVTPAIRVIHAIWQVDAWNGLVKTVIDDPLDKASPVDAIQRFVTFIGENWDGKLPATGILMLPEYSERFPHEPDTALLLPPSHHYAFKVEAPHLQRKTVICDLVYHCEFTGQESRDEYTYCIRTWRPPVADWSRRPWPRILAASHQWRDGKRYKRGFANTRADVLVHPIREISENEELELRNFRDHDVLIRKEAGTYVVTLDVPAQQLKITGFLTVLEFLTGWVLDDVWEADHPFVGWRKRLFGI